MTNSSLYRPCVGIVLFNDAGLVLACERLNFPGHWQFPQGGIDEGEEIQNALFREMEEEIGTGKAIILDEIDEWLFYDFTPEIIAKHPDRPYRGQKQKWFALRYTGSDEEIDLNGDDHPEFQDWRWMKFEDVVENMIPFKREAYQKVFSVFRHFSDTKV